jgi:hypothetical protein
MQIDTPIRLTKKQHDDVLQFVRNVYMFLGGNNLNLRAGLEWRDRVYYRETDWTAEQLKARLANYNGDAKKLQNATVPVVQPQVEATVGYLTEVFCTGEPFFGVVAPAKQVDAGLQMESVIGDNSRRFGWRAEFMKCFRDGLKYNLQALEMAWETKKVFSVINDPAQRLEKSGVQAAEMYSGNMAKRIDLYNIILDTRVRPNENHIRGEFAGYVDLYPRTNLKQLVIDLGPDSTMNVTDAFQSNCGSYMVGNNTPGEYYIPLINPMALINQSQTLGTNWSAWLSGITKNGQIEYRDLYEVAVIYARFMPSDFNLNLPARNTPQIFKMIIVNKQHIIYMKRMSNAHNFLPIVVGQPFDDGLGYQAKSFGDNVTPYQEMASALWNSGIESKRRLVYDRLFYDPSRVSKTDIDKTSSVARIPVKPGAYGKPVGDAIFSANYRDDQVVGVLQMAAQVQQMAQVANGTNNVQQGQFQKGNKTRAEFETVMNKSDWHPRLLAITLEDSWFGPIKEIVKMNTIQYQGPAELYNFQKQENVTVNPQDLRTASMQFKLTDGQTPTEKMLNMEVLGQVAQVGMAVPEINAQYDIVGMLLYSWKTQGAYWLDQFKRTPEQMQQFLQSKQAVTNSETTPKEKAEAKQIEQTPPQLPAPSK